MKSSIHPTKRKDDPAVRLVVFLAFLPILQTLLLPWMPGLNSDTAKMGLIAAGILHTGRIACNGTLPPYNGLVRVFLIYLSFLLLGVNRLALEIPFAAFNSLAILLTFNLVRKLFRTGAALVVVMVLSVSPWFVVRNIDNWYYLVLVAALCLFSAETSLSFLIGGVILGLGCYEHQLAAVIPLSLLVTYLTIPRENKPGAGRIVFAMTGIVLGFSPRLVYSLAGGGELYMEPFNHPLSAAKRAAAFFPYFLGMLNGTVIYLRNTGCVRCLMIPLNAAVFLASALMLALRGRQVILRALVVFFLSLYCSLFLVIKYTAIRYFLCPLFVAGVISGIGIYLVSLKNRKVGYALLTAYVALNSFYLFYNYFDEFSRSGGRLKLFRLGNLIEASHHLVRTDILYDKLDGNVKEIVSPEPFILECLKFYDIDNGRFSAFSRSISGQNKTFYFIDYAKSKLGIRIVPGMFPAYNVRKENLGLDNFSVYLFTRKKETGPAARDQTGDFRTHR